MNKVDKVQLNLKSAELISIRERKASLIKRHESLEIIEQILESEVIGLMKDLKIENHQYGHYNLIPSEGKYITVEDPKKVAKFCHSKLPIGMIFDRSALLEAIDNGMEIPGVKVEQEEHLRLSLTR